MATMNWLREPMLFSAIEHFDEPNKSVIFFAPSISQRLFSNWQAPLKEKKMESILRRRE